MALLDKLKLEDALGLRSLTKLMATDFEELLLMIGEQI